MIEECEEASPQKRFVVGVAALEGRLFVVLFQLPREASVIYHNERNQPMHLLPEQVVFVSPNAFTTLL